MNKIRDCILSIMYGVAGMIYLFLDNLIIAMLCMITSVLFYLAFTIQDVYDKWKQTKDTEHKILGEAINNLENENEEGYCMKKLK